MVPESAKWLLVTDVDDTLDGDRGALRDFAKRCRSVLLVLNSSRPRASVQRTLEGFPEELEIRGLITALGTEVMLGGEDRAEWRRRFGGWDRDLVVETVTAAGGIPHAAEMQAPYKASFAVPRQRWREVEAGLLERAPGVRTILSGESDFDVVPASAGKGEATLYVADRLGVPRERLIVAGDSGNDLSMFEVAAMAVAVGNARRELIEAADPVRTYFARAPRAAGLSEGLLHWGALDPA